MANSPAREPRRIEVHLGTRCNSRCIFCMSSVNRDAREPWAIPRRVKEELRHFYAQGCRAAGFLGGEPTVYPRIVDCVAYARNLGYAKILICTNGMRLADPDFCRRLVEAGVTRVTVSVHSHKAAIEDRLIMRVPGALARKVRAVRNLVGLRDRGLLPGNISLNPVLCRPTLRGMEGFVRFFGGLGIDDVRFNYIWPHGEVREDPAWTPSFREAMPEVVKLLIAVYDNCNSLHTNAFDEAITTPTEDSVRRAMAIQLIINREWGLAKNENPNQGAFVIDELTELVEEAVLAEFEKIADRGGVLGAMETGYQRSKIQEESMHYEMLKHTGEYPIIGVNTFRNPHGYAVPESIELARSTEDEKQSQLQRLADFHNRHAAEAPVQLARLQQAVIENRNVFEVLMDAVRCCSLGQITRALFEVGGQYRRSM
jgi:MoaA/NifB/PqqE/SkfB family radical SAM enzyme